MLGKAQTEEAINLKQSLFDSLMKEMELAKEKGSSTWLTALQIKVHVFSLHKRTFMTFPSQLPSHCACGNKTTIEHALSCPKGGFPSIRHNEIRDMTAKLWSEVCTDVKIEPELQPLTGELLQHKTANREDGARLDLSARGL